MQKKQNWENEYTYSWLLKHRTQRGLGGRVSWGAIRNGNSVRRVDGTILGASDEIKSDEVKNAPMLHLAD